MLRKFGIIAVLSLIVAALAAVPALAQVNFDNAPSGTHFRQGEVAPVCDLTQTGTLVALDCTGTILGGVGNTNANLAVTLDATANFVCRNPGNRNIVEPHSDAVSDDLDVTIPSTRNGQLRVPVVDLEISAADAAAEFECPNTRWLEQFQGFSNVSFTYELTFAGFTEPAISLPNST
jgi:hypothetical protein